MNPIKVTFLNKPRIEPITEYKRCLFTLFLLKCTYPKYRLVEDLVVEIQFDNNEKHIITVSSGYETDGASIPRIFWSIYPPDGGYRYSAILHDALYQSKSYTRFINDNIFKLGMSGNVPDSTRNLFYNAVRVGGYFVYLRHSTNDIQRVTEYIHITKI